MEPEMIVDNAAAVSRRAAKDCNITQYHVMNGIDVLFYDIHAERLDYSWINMQFPADMISIQHCREGRFEGEYASGDCFYLGAGDLTLNLPETSPRNNTFPLSHYHGINIIVAISEATASLEMLKPILGSLSIDLPAMHQRLQEGNKLVILRSVPAIEHILSEVYQAQEPLDASLLTLKVLELLLYLSRNPSVSDSRTYFDKHLVFTVKAIRQYLIDHMDEHITTESISKIFDIPITSLKNCFRNIYGVPIQTFVREYRMHSAAELLQNTKMSIGQIADASGYESPSKFTAGFKNHFGYTPSEFRKQQTFLSARDN